MNIEENTALPRRGESGRCAGASLDMERDMHVSSPNSPALAEGSA